MATNVVQPITIFRQSGKDAISWNLTPGEESGQSYKAGAPLVLDSTSRELEVWAGGTDTSAIVGIAVNDASGTAGTAVPFYDASPSNEFAITLVNGASEYTLTGEELGKSYSLIASGDNWCGDIADITTTKIVVTGFISAVGDVNPRVTARFLQAAQALSA